MAHRYVEETGRHVFLTGKAGTGKTTFLKKLKQSSSKRMVIVAPTGVAAINAGGVTIHSFFQLPFAPFVPGSTLQQNNYAHRFGKEKINIIRSLDLLVIDEISMVRADLLDHIDSVLRRYRDKEKPFGGVQLLMIGDMQQLAPVIKEEEKHLLSSYYETLFFFGSLSLQKTSYVTIELKTVYRQSDTHFLMLLNKIRSNQIDEQTFSTLNLRYLPNFNPKEDEGYITLTTHNRQAQYLNQQKLEEIPEKSYKYEALIQGDFPEQLYPTEKTLLLKRGAQIMFIKNDTETPRRFYNGKLGKVWSLSSDSIQILCEDWHEPITLKRMQWDNTQYTLNEETKEIEEKIEGSFEHYPIKTAWAITIHKSQGLTFDRVIINAGSSFAHGQVYVALSRCRTLEGLVLSTPLTPSVLINDETISSFSEKVAHTHHEEQEVLQSTQEYFYQLLCELFDFKKLQNALFRLERILDEHLYHPYPRLLEEYKKECPTFTEQTLKVADKFRTQYTSICYDPSLQEDSKNELLQKRITAAAPYFLEQVTRLKPLQLASTTVETDNKTIRKRWEDTLFEFTTLLHQKIMLLTYAKEGFSLQSYLKVRAQSMITDSPAFSKRKVREKSVTKLEVSADMLHPELFETLKRWRNKKAGEIGLPVYTVIQQKAMLGISNLMPANKEELIRIPYFGKKGTEKYGTEILEIVIKYRRKKGLSLL